jgi:hypothetical protein
MMITPSRAIAGSLFLALVFAACAPRYQIPAGFDEDISDGANRIVIERQVPGIEPNAAAMSLFYDAQRHLEEHGFDIQVADEETMTIVTEPTQLEDDLALQVTASVRIEPGGSLLIASSDWAPSTVSPETQWQEAEWTDGMSREAFGKTLALFEGLPNRNIGTTTE